jgi:hypothetical protein
VHSPTSFAVRARRTACLALLAVSAVGRPACAQSVRPLVEASLEYGGDQFLTVIFEDGGEQELRAGQGGTIAAGAVVRPSDNTPLSIRGTVGFKYVTTAADNANITFTRVPIEVVAMYGLPNHLWAGAGYVRHTAIRFDGDGFAEDVDFKDGNGATVELGWKYVALTYTAIKYPVEGSDGIDASSVGLSLTYAFGGR